MGPSAANNISLRGVQCTDLPLILAWRSDREIMRYLPSAPEKPMWEEHYEYWHKMGHRDWIVEMHSDAFPDAPPRPVGIVHAIPLTGEVGVIIGDKNLWSHGIAIKALRLMLKRVEKYKLVQEPIWAAIHPKNVASQRVFTKAGFMNTHETTRNGQERWVLQ